MKWHFLDPDLSGFRDGIPDMAGSALVMSPVHDFRAELIEPEPIELTRMAEVRQLGFSGTQIRSDPRGKRGIRRRWHRHSVPDHNGYSRRRLIKVTDFFACNA